MEARPQTIRQVFSNGGDIQYILPHFQREYTWEQEDWKTLLDDLYATHTAHRVGAQKPEHFMGSLVRVESGTRHGIPTYTLVDGQQRLTTLSLLLCAIRAVLDEQDGGTARRIERMLVNADEPEAAPSRYKLVPTIKHGDRAAYIAALTGKPGTDAAAYSDSYITQAYAYLLQSVREAVGGEVDAHTLYDTVMECFQVVTIDLKPDEQPYKIFESLNGKGKPLTPADLVRNYVAMTLPAEMQERVFTEHWAPIDDRLQERREVGSSRYGELTGFLRHYLAMRTRALFDREHLYERFRDRVKEMSPAAFADEIAAMHRFAEYYDRLLRPEREPDATVRAALARLQTFEMTTAFPFILRAYAARDGGEITPAQFLDVLTVLENYAVRRFLCGKQANYLNSMFPLLWDDLDLADFSASLRRSLAARQYPADEDVRAAVRTRNAYERRNARRLAQLFAAVNRSLSAGSGGYTILDAEPTFEHIMPQTLTPTWKTDLGAGWETEHASYLHTLGNLTVVTQGWNSSLSNESFTTKRDRLRANALRLNSEYFARPIDRWDEGAILARADWLTDHILAIWPTIGTALRSPTSRVGFTIGAKPSSVTIAGNTYPVTHWSEVLEQTAAFLVERNPSGFDALVQRFPHLFLHEKPSVNRGPYPLPNGWWLCSYWGSKNIRRYCRELILAAGLRESDWQVEETA